MFRACSLIQNYSHFAQFSTAFFELLSLPARSCDSVTCLALCCSVSLKETYLLQEINLIVIIIYINKKEIDRTSGMNGNL